MQAWVADGSDSSLQNQHENDMEQLLDLEDEESDMEEFAEIINGKDNCDLGHKHQTIDLLTGDEATHEDSNKDPKLILFNEIQQENLFENEPDGGKVENETKAESLSLDLVENYCRQSIDYLIAMMNKQADPHHIGIRHLHENENEIENHVSNDMEGTNDKSISTLIKVIVHENNAETNCLKVNCAHCTRCIECGIRRKSTQDKIKNPNETGNGNANEIFTDAYGTNSLHTVNRDIDEISKELRTMMENNSQAVVKEINSTNPNADSEKCVEKVSSFEVGEEVQKENQSPLNNATNSPRKLEEESCEDSKSSEKEEQVKSITKTKKRVTFADEKELKKNWLGMEPMMAKHEQESNKVRETQPDLATALRFMTEVYPNREDEDMLSDSLSMITESNPLSLSRKNSPTAAELYEEFKNFQGEDNSDSQIRNSLVSAIKSSPKRTNVQESTVKEEINPTEKPKSKFSKFCKSLRKRMGKIM